MLAGVGGQHRMARPYSQDLRDRVVGSVASGRSCRATAALFRVSVASVVKWTQRWRATGITTAKQMGGWKQLLLKLFGIRSFELRQMDSNHIVRQEKRKAHRLFGEPVANAPEGSARSAAGGRAGR